MLQVAATEIHLATHRGQSSTLPIPCRVPDNLLPGHNIICLPRCVRGGSPPYPRGRRRTPLQKPRITKTTCYCAPSIGSILYCTTALLVQYAVPTASRLPKDGQLKTTPAVRLRAAGHPAPAPAAAPPPPRCPLPRLASSSSKNASSSSWSSSKSSSILDAVAPSTTPRLGSAFPPCLDSLRGGGLGAVRVSPYFVLTRETRLFGVSTSAAVVVDDGRVYLLSLVPLTPPPGDGDGAVADAFQGEGLRGGSSVSNSPPPRNPGAPFDASGLPAPRCGVTPRLVDVG